MSDVVSPGKIAATLVEHWSPRVVAELDDSYVKVARLLGTVVLREGEAFVVPKGVRHNPIAEQECHVMLIERKSTLHTGAEVTDKTRTVADQLRPV